uniref:Uncharacterized protein n=1 Tax=Anguilla anguilla TaxID=7936 RepID=A0A0E9UAL3_ANGAN
MLPCDTDEAAQQIIFTLWADKSNFLTAIKQGVSFIQKIKLILHYNH